MREKHPTRARNHCKLVVATDSIGQEESGASGEIRTLKHLLLRQAAIPRDWRRHSWCTGKDLNLRVTLGETVLQPVRFSRAHAPQTWRKPMLRHSRLRNPCRVDCAQYCAQWRLGAACSHWNTGDRSPHEYKGMSLRTNFAKPLIPRSTSTLNQ